MKASVYGIKNLQRILPNLKNWTREPNDDYSHLRNMYDELLGQYRRYMMHVLKNVGGEYHTPRKVEESGNAYELVEYEKQKEAMQFLDTYLFNTPAWLINDSIISLTDYNISSYIKTCQSGALNRLQSSDMLNRMIKNEELKKSVKIYPVSEFMEDLKKSVWRELYTKNSIDIHRRGLQKTYIENAFNLLKNAGSDDSSLMRAHLLSLKKDIKKAIGSQKDLSKYHLQDILQRIDDTLNKAKD
jgi:hypothetical protein